MASALFIVSFPGLWGSRISGWATPRSPMMPERSSTPTPGSNILMWQDCQIFTLALGLFLMLFFSPAAPRLTWEDGCTRLPPQTGGIWVQPFFVSLTASCVPAAAMSRGEGGLITDCSVFLPAPLGETHTVNWMRTPREPNCGWGWPLLHENNILYQRAGFFSHFQEIQWGHNRHICSNVSFDFVNMFIPVQ